MIVWLFVGVVALEIAYLRSRAFRTESALKATSDPMGGTDRLRGGGSAAVQHGQLMTLDPTARFLIDSRTKKPVFITGDDAFSLQVQLSDPDIQFYLSDRAARGFNAIWMGLADNTYSNHPPKDFYGNAPFDGAAFTNEDPAYWKRVDQTLKWAADRGITVLANPAFVGYGCKEGYCESYRSSSMETLTAYGRFLGDRYKRFPNIIWLIGGDADPRDDNVQSKLCALAKAIKSADPVHLMTTENYRGTSSQDIWTQASWLDLDAMYLEPTDILTKTSAEYQRHRRPMFMLEDWYEGEHSMTELGVRTEGYWAVLSGCTTGRVFGNYALWDFTWTPHTDEPWKKQLDSTGSIGQSFLGKLFRSREHWKLVPDSDHTVMTAGYDSRDFFSSAWESLRSVVRREPYRIGGASSAAARTSDGQTIIAYVPNGNLSVITIDMSKITDPGAKAKGWWFSPGSGSATLIGAFSANGKRSFRPPDSGDWVLVLDSEMANLAAPGTKDL